MNSQEKMSFCKLLTGIAEFYSKTLYTNDLDIYWSVLEKYELDKIKQALKLHIVNPKSGQFMPKPADIIRYLEKDDSLKALYGWDKAIAGVRQKGAYKSIEFDDPIVNIVINEMGGWVDFCYKINKDNSPFIANEFQRRYAAYLICPNPLAPEYLPGIFECQNRLNGYHNHIPKPDKFGDNDLKLLISNFNLAQLENDDASK